MKFGNYGKNLFLLAALIAGLGLILAGRVTAQSFTVLHSFTGGNDGASPQGGLILSGKILYGTASAGGNAGNGTAFAVHTDGTGFASLHSFTRDSSSSATNSAGGTQQAALMLLGNSLASPQAGLILWFPAVFGGVDL